jgi:mannosyltransferase
MNAQGSVHRIRRLNWSTWLPLGLALLAFAVRVAGLTAQSLWRDEVDALMFATQPLPELLNMFRRPGDNGPLFFLALRPWLATAGHSEFSLRFPSALLGTLAVPLCYALVARLTDRRVALLTALLLALAPYHIWYGQEAKMYAALTVLVPASLLLTVEAARRGGLWRWALLYIVTSLSFYTHLLAALIVPVQVIWLALLPAADRRRRWLTIAGYLAVLFLPYLPLAAWQAGMWLGTFETGHPFVPLGDIFRVLTAVFSIGVLAGRGWLILLPYMLALVAGALLWAMQGERRSRLRTVALLLTWLLPPPLMVFGVSLGMPIFTERYLIWCLPAYLTLLALGITALAQLWRPMGLATLLVVLALNLSSIAQQTYRPIKSDFRAAAAYVRQQIQPGDLLVYQIPYIRYTFTYYYDPQGDPRATAAPWLDGPYTNREMTEAEVDAWMAQGLENAPAAWLIASEAPMWDARGLTEQWLAEQGRVTAHQEFSRVAVTRYELEQ